MDEPTHRHESEFWDQVAEWLLEPPQLSQAQQAREAPSFPPGPDSDAR